MHFGDAVLPLAINIHPSKFPLFDYHTVNKSIMVPDTNNTAPHAPAHLDARGGNYGHS